MVTGDRFGATRGHATITQTADLVGCAIGHDVAHGGFSEDHFVFGGDGDLVGGLGHGDVLTGIHGHGFTRLDLFQRRATGGARRGTGG